MDEECDDCGGPTEQEGEDECVEEENKMTLPNIISGILGSIVENTTLEESLQKVGLSEEMLIKEWIAPHSSPTAIEYSRELISIAFVEISKDGGEELYLVKKVLCAPEYFEGVAEAVSCEDNDKFKVLRLIGCNPNLMKYTQDGPGMEAYLVSGKTELHAMRRTTKDEPIFKFHATGFDGEMAGEFDELINKVMYAHRPEDMENLLSALGMM
ncbi:hypothetical protein ACFL96_18400 [Thermoproteota archaeon]